MNNENRKDSETTVDDIYLGELAASIAQHERAESNRARRMIDEQEKRRAIARRLPVINPWDVQ